MLETDIAVVGAGPGGMAAALAAVDVGATVTICDEYPKPGGQFFKRSGEAFVLTERHLGAEHALGEKLRRALSNKRISLLSGTLVWGAFSERQLMILHEGRSEVLRAKAIVLSPGAYDRPVPFPGWTLPGVMTAGGAQSLAKTQWIKPGSRMLLAGAGPFVLPVAASLLRAGVEIAAIVEATRPREWLAHAAALWGQWPRFAEAFAYQRILRKAGVPVIFGHKIIRAEGGNTVTGAVIGPVDRDWHVRAASERHFEVDAVATGYGFLPNIELAENLECEMRWDPHGQAWFVDVSDTQATSRPGVFAAGEITGIGGSAIALCEGEVAGLSAAEFAGLIDGSRATQLRRSHQRARRHLQRFGDMVNELFAPRPGLWDALTTDAIICRCEEVTANEVRHCVQEGCASIKEVKDWTRAGMGLCQGRVCRSLVTQTMAMERSIEPKQIPRSRIRPPIKPVPIDVLVASEDPEGAVR